MINEVEMTTIYVLQNKMMLLKCSSYYRVDKNQCHMKALYGSCTSFAVDCNNKTG